MYFLKNKKRKLCGLHFTTFRTFSSHFMYQFSCIYSVNYNTLMILPHFPLVENPFFRLHISYYSVSQNNILSYTNEKSIFHSTLSVMQSSSGNRQHILSSLCKPTKIWLGRRLKCVVTHCSKNESEKCTS